MDNDFIIKKNPLGKDIYLCAYLGNADIVTIPDGVTFIRSYAFADDDKPNNTIKKIIIPDSVNTIDTAAFAYCRALKEIRWPHNEDFKTWGIYLFKGCDSLEEISIPESIHTIINFQLPPNLKYLESHDDITAISQSAFISEKSTKENKDFRIRNTIKILLHNPNYKIVNGFMINEKHKTALFYVNHNRKSVRVPDGIETIGLYCFDQYGYFNADYKINDYLKSEIIPVENITLPASVKTVCTGAFFNCNNLKLVNYYGKEKDISVSPNAFENCPKINPFESKILCSDTVVKNKKHTKNNLQRLLIIHKEIKKGTYPNTEELRELCTDIVNSRQDINEDYVNFSTSSISRDIRFLRKLGAKINYDAEKGGYYYEDDFELSFT